MEEFHQLSLKIIKIQYVLACRISQQASSDVGEEIHLFL
jgi:hypothetical protein